MPLLIPPVSEFPFLDFPLRRMRHVAVVIDAVLPHLLRHQVILEEEHRAHHHIEDGGLEWIPLCDASLSVEGLSIVPSCPHHHLNPLPITAKEGVAQETPS